MQTLIKCLLNAPLQAVVLSDATQGLDGPALVAQARALAHSLRLHGVRRLALYADNSIAWVLSDLACQLAEIPFLPLPPFFTASQCAYALHQGGIDSVLGPAQMVLPPAYLTLPAAVLPGLELKQAALLEVPALPPGTGKLTFTSGSTGSPKGVCLSTAQQLQQAQVLATAVGLQAPRHLCVLPLSTLLENIAGVYAPLLAGGTVALRSLGELGMSGSRMVQPQRFLQLLATLRPDTLILIPQLLQLLVQAVKGGWVAPPLRYIAVGGSRVSAALIVAARAAGLPVYQGYGLSECVSVVSLNTPRDDRPGSCGKVLPHVAVSVVDGALRIAGNAMLGYAGQPQSWGQSYIDSGDLGRIDNDGFVYIEGRRNNLLISSYGRNIAPEWVESELLASPAFSEVVVLGDARPWCVALLSPRYADLRAPQIQQVIDAANARLPDYAQVRRWYRLPHSLASQGLLTANGRPRRPQIAQAYAAELQVLYSDAGFDVAAVASH